jgi:acyl-CoA synthetase (AMP-forming)/AMP-acid ligase II
VALLVDHLRAFARAFPGEIAYRIARRGPDDELTFSEWEDESNRLARLLTRLRVQKGDRVGLYLTPDDALRFMVGYAAIHKAGAVAVPLNTRLAPREVALLVAHSEPRVLLAESTLVEMASEAARAAGGVDHLIVADRNSATTPAVWPPAEGEEADTYQVGVGGDDLADILYTSGTTGWPKGVAIEHRNAAMIPGEPSPTWSGRAWLHASPLFTFAGIGFVYNPMRLGMSGVYMPSFDADQWLDTVERIRPQAVFMVPAMAQLLVSHKRSALADLSSIELCSVGSSPLAPATLRALMERMPEALVSNSYGMTEAGAAYCLMPKGESLRRVGSVGKPVPPLEVRIVDSAENEHGVAERTGLAVGEVGEVLLRLPGHERRYYRDPEATGSTWKEGWLHTGDLGYLDTDGFLYISGRKKDVIVRGGNNVHANDVESVLLAHPDIAEAAVIGVPHPVLGEDVVGAVVLHPWATSTADDVVAHCAERLADYKTPRRIELLGSLPRNATGKVLKHELKQIVASSSAASATDRG